MTKEEKNDTTRDGYKGLAAGIVLQAVKDIDAVYREFKGIDEAHRKGKLPQLLGKRRFTIPSSIQTKDAVDAARFVLEEDGLYRQILETLEIGTNTKHLKEKAQYILDNHTRLQAVATRAKKNTDEGIV